MYERGVIAATRVYELQEEGSDLHFVPCHASSQQMLKHAMLDTKKVIGFLLIPPPPPPPPPPTGGRLCIYYYYYFQIFLLDFVSEVYVWVGRQSPTKLRKRALEMGKAHFDGDCKPAVFQHVPARTSVARASGRLRKNSLGRQSKHNLNASIRKTSKDAKPMTRPSWALFARVVEGGESILLREKFSDWPEQGRLIKMKGHEASVKLMVVSGLGRSTGTGSNGCVLACVHKSTWLLTEHMNEYVCVSSSTSSLLSSPPFPLLPSPSLSFPLSFLPPAFPFG